MNDLTAETLAAQLDRHGAEFYASEPEVGRILTAIVRVEAQLGRNLTFEDDDLLDGALLRQGLRMHTTTVERVLDSAACAREEDDDCYCS